MVRLGQLCFRRRWVVIGVWVICLVGVSVSATRSGEHFTNTLDVPGTESQKAFDLLQERFTAVAGDSITLAVRATTSVEDPSVRPRVERVIDGIGGLEHISFVSSPYDDPARSAISESGTIAFATVQLEVRGRELPVEIVEQMKSLADDVAGDDLQLEFGGRAVQSAEQEGPGESERIGLIVAVLVLLITFGSVVAAGLPLASALFGLGGSMMLITLLGRVTAVSDFAPQLAAMVGLGVGIDYSLLVVTRYRQALHRGLSPQAALVEAVSTAGRSVVFAGITVVISLLGLILVGVQIVTGMALAAATAVLVTMIGSVTLLPAMLAVLGRSVDRFRLPLLGRRRRQTTTRWFRWSRLVQRHPVVWALVGASILLMLTLPAFSMRLGTADAGNNPESRTVRRAYDMLAEGFGPGVNGPLLVVAEVADPNQGFVVEDLRFAIEQESGVASVSPASPNVDGDTVVFRVFPTTSPQDVQTELLITHLRESVAPRITAGTDVDVFVGGVTATFADLSDVLAGRLPRLIIAVVVLSFLLLTAVFRSVVVSIKAGLMNLLSVTAAYGIVVAVFQWGWGLSLVGLDRTGPIEPFVPVFMFAILFGLSMDYEVFLLSRIREEYDRTGDNSESVADGLASTAQVITAAAAIMVTLFGSFTLGDDRILKLFGLGLASAILVDATIVRTMLVPATMELMGRANWWMPAWLERVLPSVDIEGAAVEENLATPEQPVPTSPLAVEASASDDPAPVAAVSAVQQSDTDPVVFIEALVQHELTVIARLEAEGQAGDELRVAQQALEILSRRVIELHGTLQAESDAMRPLRALAREAAALRIRADDMTQNGTDVVSGALVGRWAQRSDERWARLEIMGLLGGTPPPSRHLVEQLTRMYRSEQRAHAGSNGASSRSNGDDLEVVLAFRLDELADLISDDPADVDELEADPVTIDEELKRELLDRPVDRELVELYQRARGAS